MAFDFYIWIVIVTPFASTNPSCQSHHPMKLDCPIHCKTLRIVNKQYKPILVKVIKIGLQLKPIIR